MHNQVKMTRRPLLGLLPLLLMVGACGEAAEKPTTTGPSLTIAPSQVGAVQAWYDRVMESAGYEQNYFLGAFDTYTHAEEFERASRACDTLGLAKFPGWRETIGTAPEPSIDALMQEYLDRFEAALVACVAADGDTDALLTATYQIIDARAPLLELQSRLTNSGG